MRRLIAIVLLPALATACHKGGDHAEAKALIASHCGTCHVVPGISSAVGTVGPSLAGIARRQIIAGRFENNPATMERWIMHPQALQPGGAMPEMGLTGAQAHAIADYLYTLDGK